MSDIQQNLAAILEAIYGRDVRQAIHDAIEDCYEDGKSGATDLKARDEIDKIKESVATTTALAEETKARTDSDAAMNGRINKLVQDYNLESVETTLWEASTTSDGSITGSELTLTDDIANYQYVDIVVNATSGNAQSDTFPAIENQSFSLRCFNLSDFTNGTGIPAISGGEFKFKIVGNKFTILNHSYVRFSTLSGDPQGGNVNQLPTPLNGGEGRIVKIVGRKIIVNAEVSDARVGADGTVYESLGEAIREQVAAIPSGWAITVDQDGYLCFDRAEETEGTTGDTEGVTGETEGTT